MKLSTIVFLILLSCTTAPLLVFQFINYENERAHTYEDAVSRLKDIADIQRKRINSLIYNQKLATSLITSRTQFRNLLRHSNDEITSDKTKDIGTILDQAASSSPAVIGVAVYLKDKSLLYSNYRFFGDSFIANNQLIAVEKFGEQQVMVSTSEVDLDGQTIGYLAIAFTANALRELVGDFTGLGYTGEIVLASRNPNGDAVFLTPTRHDPDVALNLTVPKENLKIPITHAINGVENVFTDYLDYREVPVLAMSMPIDEVQWGMVVKIDRAEVFQKLETLKYESLRSVVIAFLFSAILSILIVQWLLKPFTTIRNALSMAADNQRKPILQRSRIAEIEEVTQAYNMMIKQLSMSEDALHDSISELTELNTKLDSEAERFNRWKESNFIGIIHSDAQGNIIDANTTLLDMIGYTQQELRNNEIDCKELTPPEYLHLDIKAVEEANEKGYWTPFEKVYRHKDGHEVPILIGGSIFNYDSQEFIVFIVNLSEKHEQTRVLEQYKGIVENSRDFFAFVDNEYRYRTVNQAYLDLHKKARKEVIGHKVEEILGKEFFEQRLKDNIDKALSGEQVVFVENLGERSREVISLKVSYIPYRAENGDILGFIFKGEDITELLAQQKTIELKEAEQKRIIDSMLEGIFTTDGRGIILSFNPEAEKIFGYQKNEIIGQSVDVLTDGVGHQDQKIEQFVTTGQSSIINNRLGRDIRARRKDGSTFPIRIAVASMPPSDNGEYHFIANFQDMSEQERQTKLLNRRLKLESLGNVAGGVAHDVNNILGIILGYSDLLADNLSDKASCIEAIEKACARGQKLTGDLLTFAKKGNRSAVNVDINELINKNRSLLETAMTSKITLEIELEQNANLVCIEENLFEDLLLNMSINAMHAMPNGGKFVIQSRTVKLDADEAQAIGVEPGEHIAVSFTDEGQGISENNLDKIFDPFFTTKEDFGNGLGLSQCYGFVKANKGAIDVYSEVDEGTQFIVYLPVSKAIQAPEEKPIQPNTDALPATLNRLLIVDDEDDIRFLIKAFLSKFDVSTTETASPSEALKIIREQKIDFVITDVIMPDISGIELMDKIEKIAPGVPHLYISGYMSAEQKLALKKDQILYKPFNKQQLIARISKLYSEAKRG